MDAGGMTHEYIEKYKNQLAIRYIDQGNREFASSSPITLDMYPECLRSNSLVNAITQVEPDTQTYTHWEVLDGFLVHYREGGNWNKKSFYDHAIKSRTFVSQFVGSFF